MKITGLSYNEMICIKMLKYFSDLNFDGWNNH